MDPLPAVLRIAIIISASLAIMGHYVNPPRRLLIYIFKPLATILILALAVLPGTFIADPYARGIAVGLLLSLAGDVWLMLPGNRFIQGLASFLLAHLCYAFAFRDGATANGFAVVLFGLAAVGVGMLAYLWRGLSTALKAPVCIYIAAIVTMAALAVSRAIMDTSAGNLSAAVGALLFVGSDATLAINRFRKPFRLAQAVVLGLYFAAQLLIAGSVDG